MMIAYHKSFVKDFRKLPSRNKEKFKERLKLFGQDEFNPVLNNHALRGKYQGYRSINVAGDLRAIFKQEKDNVIFVAINTHNNLYR